MKKTDDPVQGDRFRPACSGVKRALVPAGVVVAIGGVAVLGWLARGGGGRFAEPAMPTDGMVVSGKQGPDWFVREGDGAKPLIPGTEHPETLGRGDGPMGYDERMRREIGEPGIRLMARLVEIYNTPDLSPEERKAFLVAMLDSADAARQDGDILNWSIPTTMIARTNLLHGIDVEASIEQLLAVASEPAVPPTLRLNAMDSVADALLAQLRRQPTGDLVLAQRALDAIGLSLDLIDRIDPDLDRFGALYAHAWDRRASVLDAMRDSEGAATARLTLVDGPHAHLVAPQIRGDAYQRLAEAAAGSGDFAAAREYVAQAMERIPREARSREFPVLHEMLRFQERHGISTGDAMPLQGAELLELWRRSDLAEYPLHLQIGTHAASALRSTDPVQAVIVLEEVIQRSQQLLEASTPGSAEYHRARYAINYATRERIMLYAMSSNSLAREGLLLEAIRDEAASYLDGQPDLPEWEVHLIEERIIFQR